MVPEIRFPTPEEQKALNFWYMGARDFGTGHLVRTGYKTNPSHPLDKLAPAINGVLQRSPNRSTKESLSFHWRDLPTEVRPETLIIERDSNAMKIGKGPWKKIDQAIVSLYAWQTTVWLGPDLAKISPEELLRRGGWRYAFVDNSSSPPLRQFCSVVIPGYRWIGALVGPGTLNAAGIGANDFDAVPLAGLGPFGHRDHTTIL